MGYKVLILFEGEWQELLRILTSEAIEGNKVAQEIHTKLEDADVMD